MSAARRGLTRPPSGPRQRRALVERLRAWGRESGFSGEHLEAGAQLWAVAAPLARFGTPAQKRRFLAPLVSGAARASAAVSEEGAGSDAAALACAAAPDGAGWRLTGRKLYVSGAKRADFFLVWARRPGTTGSAALSCFLVDRRSAGLRVDERPWLIGPAGARAGSLRLSGCRVPEGRRLGEEGQGWAIFSYAMELERRYLLAPAVGAMERALARARARAAARRQFGRPIAEFRAVSRALARMARRAEEAATLLSRAAATEPRFGDPLAARVKAFISEAWTANCLDAIQLHGAHGCLNEPWLRDDLHAALASRLFSGANEIQRAIIARSRA